MEGLKFRAADGHVTCTSCNEHVYESPIVRTERETGFDKMQLFKPQAAAQRLSLALSNSLRLVVQGVREGQTMRQRGGSNRHAGDALWAMSRSTYLIYALLEAISSCFHTRELLKATSVSVLPTILRAARTHPLEDTFLQTPASIRICGGAPLLPHLDVPAGHSSPLLASLLARFGVSTELSAEAAVKAIRVIAADVAAADADASAEIAHMPSSGMFVDVFTALYSHLASQLDEEQPEGDEASRETLHSIIAAFDTEKLIFIGGPERDDGATSHDRPKLPRPVPRGALDMQHALLAHEGNERYLAARAPAARAPAAPARKPLILLGSACWEDGPSAQMLQRTPLRPIYPSLRRLFVSTLGVDACGPELGVGALRALAETPWHLACNRLVNVASVSDAFLAIADEVDSHLRHASAGQLEAALAPLQKIFLLARRRGCGGGEMTKLVQAKKLGMYYCDSKQRSLEVYGRLDTCRVIRSPPSGGLWVADKQWTSKLVTLTHALRKANVLSSLGECACFGPPQLAGGGKGASPACEEPVLRSLAR